MTAKAASAKPRASRTLRAVAPSAIVGTAPIAADPAPRIVPSSPQPVPLGLLRRAPENVRHTRVDEDVVPLADDIAAHGLLQSLIGYQSADGAVQIVGGGRRFQALRHLENEGVIDGDWPVPVLLRDVDDAIELSLAENLQQRTMSPVDEFVAFRALMARGDTSPAQLAARFGYSERVVRQRLRLAELAPPVLDALAAREISIDVAMAYASTQDAAIQAEVFKAEAKRPWEPHRARSIRETIALKGATTDSALFRFIGEDAYERCGGRYEDDLFGEEKAGVRRLANPGLLIETARELAEFQSDRLIVELRQRDDFAETIAGVILAADLRLKSWGNIAPKAPAGFVAVEKYDAAPMWRTIRNNGIECHVMAGIDDTGALVAWPRIVFVPKAQKDAVAPPEPTRAYQPETPLERAIRERKVGVDRLARRLAVGPFTGTPFEGRVYWPKWDSDRHGKFGGRQGWMCELQIFVSDEAVAAQQSAAEAEYDREVAEREVKEKARDQRRDELLVLDPPAIVVVDGEAWARADDGSYAPVDEESEAGWAATWTGLIADFDDDLDDIGATFATRDDFDAAMAAVDPGLDEDSDAGVNDLEPAEAAE